ncbi:MAG: hypothetical protein GTN49_09880 [candidate division Zixibacteria bacterium]|nr:hypothetical protein [candidate division Zixibacteria bacterium]
MGRRRYGGARALEGAGLAVADEECYGCSLCVDVCAEGCIEMEARD